MTGIQKPEAFQLAALCAQDLVVAARAIEARVSALTPETPEPIVEETVALVRAIALQLTCTVHELIAVSVCLTSAARGIPHAGTRDYDTQP